MALDPETLERLPVKSVEEIVAELTEVIRRHRRKYIRRLMRPCPNNCTGATFRENRVVGCGRCGSHNPEKCFRESQFEAVQTKEALAKEFAQDLRDPYILRHDYRDIMTLLWVLGQLDGNGVPEEVISKVEYRERKTQ